MELPLSVLVVDDSETARTLTRHMLAIEGHRVVEAKDGKDALAQLEAGLAVNMILLDLNMPRLTGIQFLERAREIVTKIPVFVVTVSGDRLQVERVRELGACGYFMKPIRPTELAKAIRAARNFMS
jgi:CheY-like chemotaxis protein